MTCAVWSTATFAGGVGVVTGFTVASGDAPGAAEAAPAGVDPSPIVWTFCFLLQAAKASAKSTGAATSLSRINVRNAFNPVTLKTSGFYTVAGRFRVLPRRFVSAIRIIYQSQCRGRCGGKGAALCALFWQAAKSSRHRSRRRTPAEPLPAWWVDADTAGGTAVLTADMVRQKK